ncbi:hypothetical protein D3C73_1078920 [compost metagenome]
MRHMTFCAKIGKPLLGRLSIRQIAFVQNNQPWLVLQNIVNHRIAAGQRKAGIKKFDDNINQLQFVFDLPSGLGHMTWKPLYGHCPSPPLNVVCN